MNFLHLSKEAGVSSYGRKIAWLREAVAQETDECILWPFGKADGYGAVWFEGRVRKAHHIALILVGRDVPTAPLETRHLCGNRSCINPRHLAEGTRRENCHDTITHGRTPRGERQGAHKLTTEDVFYIRAHFIPGNSRWARGNAHELAQRFGVSVSAIHAVIARRSWSHV